MENHSSSKFRSKDSQMGSNGTGLRGINEDLLHLILNALPARSFSSAACVNRSWNRVCNRILSRPKLSSAFSLNSSLPVAAKEVVDKVFSEPIRPHFAIVNVGKTFGLKETLLLIIKELRPDIPIIVSTVDGIIGRSAVTNEFQEVKWGDPSLMSPDITNEPCENVYDGILLTVGFVPGLKVEAIPLRTSKKTSQAASIDKFVVDIREYSESVSGYPSPVAIMLFGGGMINLLPVLAELGDAMPLGTSIVGGDKNCFLYRSGNDSRKACIRVNGYTEAVALVFARDKESSLGKGAGDIQFHVVLSNGIVAVGATHKAVSVRVSSTDSCCTWLTARREGHREILNGQTILDDIDVQIANQTCPELYIGVNKRRKCAIGSGKPKSTTYMAFHGVVGGDEEYLYVDGNDIRTGDSFQFYHSDPNAALSSCADATARLKNLKLDSSSKNFHDIADKSVNVFGGFIFACCGRGETFFQSLNVDSSPFRENFPGVPLAGVYCCGEIGRVSSMAEGNGQEESTVPSYLRVYSTVYLVMSYTSPLEC